MRFALIYYEGPGAERLLYRPTMRLSRSSVHRPSAAG